MEETEGKERKMESDVIQQTLIVCFNGRKEERMLHRHYSIYPFKVHVTYLVILYIAL